ncbi:MAG: hypothetical protein DKT66_23270 [Candidatus Melainabacteria bacterium]|nr:MAG: hypothetical protein DKT66_23270 [Candidatus Melainabacteria bacterium]
MRLGNRGSAPQKAHKALLMGFKSVRGNIPQKSLESISMASKGNSPIMNLNYSRQIYPPARH